MDTSDDACMFTVESHCESVTDHMDQITCDIQEPIHVVSLDPFPHCQFDWFCVP